MNNRYQLVQPYVSDKIYESTSLMSGANKCFNEFKTTHENDFTSYPTFTIKDINTNKIYTFKINHTFIDNKNIIQNGGALKRLDDIENRLNILENKINDKNIDEKTHSDNKEIDTKPKPCLLL